MVRRHLMLAALALLLLPLPPPWLFAQQMDVSVKVNTESIPTNYREQLANFQQVITDYLRSFTYGDPAVEDQVKCTLDIFFQSATGENRYTAQVFIGSSRPIFPTNQHTAVLRLLDELWEFTYIPGRPIDHNPYAFNDLASFLDLYMYLILGCDNDTYDRLGGNDYFRKAADIASMGVSTGLRSWTPTIGGYNRVRLVRELLSAQYEPVRIASWKYHYTGLDSLAFDRDQAYANILGALEDIANVRKSTDPQNLVIKTFFDSKYQEIAAVFEAYPDRGVYARLIRIDPAHQTAYDEASRKR